MAYCQKTIKTRSRFAPPNGHLCFDKADHTGKCDEYPYLTHLREIAPKVADKIERDAVMTTGAAWLSQDAGPNRIRRWVMLKSDEELLSLGIDMASLKPQVVAKLRDKAATYDQCMAVAQKLTALVYGMLNAPTPPVGVRDYLEEIFGPIEPETTNCLVCLEPLDFDLFAAARRGQAEIETAHRNPRLHTPENVGFAHRPCNIAQGDKTLEEFYSWIARILENASERG